MPLGRGVDRWLRSDGFWDQWLLAGFAITIAGTWFTNVALLGAPLLVAGAIRSTRTLRG